MSPMNSYDVSTLLPSIRTYLIGLGVVRDPRVSASLPPMWLDPKKGVPYPGQTEGLGPNESTNTQDSTSGLLLVAYPETGIPSRPFEGFYRQKAVTIYIRAAKSPPIQGIYENQLLPALHDVRNLVMGSLQVNQSMAYRDLQRIGSDDKGYVYNCEFMFDLFAPVGPSD